LKHLRAFELYDANSDGVVSVLEMIQTMDSGDFSLSPTLEEEISKLADLMENKRMVTAYGGGFVDLPSYTTMVPVPAFPNFLKERLISNYKNKNSLFQMRQEQLIIED
jgi:hypothetical protein